MVVRRSSTGSSAIRVEGVIPQPVKTMAISAAPASLPACFAIPLCPRSSETRVRDIDDGLASGCLVEQHQVNDPVLPIEGDDRVGEPELARILRILAEDPIGDLERDAAQQPALDGARELLGGRE